MAEVSVRCVRGNADKEAEPIIDGLMTSQSVAISRGKRFLDDPSKGGYYLVKERRLRVPHKNELVIPGSWISVTDSNLGLQNTSLKVISYSLSIDINSGVFADVVTEQYIEVDL